MSEKKKSLIKFPPFQDFEMQIALNFNAFNIYMAEQNLQRAYGLFAVILDLILGDSETRFPIDEEKAREYLTLYWGKAEKMFSHPDKKNKQDILDRGLFALDVIDRDFADVKEGEWSVYLRGYGPMIRAKKIREPIFGDTVGTKKSLTRAGWSPARQHAYAILFYQKLRPLMFSLWHEIAKALEQGAFQMPKGWYDHVTVKAPKSEDDTKLEEGMEELRDVELINTAVEDGRMVLWPTDSDDGEPLIESEEI